MKQVITYILWPSLAGLVFALTFLAIPRLSEKFPALEALLPHQASAPAQSQNGRVSYSEPIRKAAPTVVSINYQQNVLQRTLKVYRPAAPLKEGDKLQGYLNTDLVENSSLGSGVIISPDGFIVTSYHVVFLNDGSEEKSSELTITLNTGKEVDGRLVALDEKNDLALLKIDEENLPYANLGDNSRLQVGDIVLAIGNPRNIGQSVSFGIISALLRRDDSYVIQTDAAINPGNSGGALIDMEGKLVGINSFIVSESGGSEGISFAVPAASAATLLKNYLESGPSGYLGVDSRAFSLNQGREKFQQDVQGFIVNDVAVNSPADKSGIKVGDIITGINGNKFSITDEEDTAEAQKAIGEISNLPPGREIIVEVFREGTHVQLPTTLGIGEPQVGGQLLRMQPRKDVPLIQDPLNQEPLVQNPGIQ